MISEFLSNAKKGEPVYISTVYEKFSSLTDEESHSLHCILKLLDEGEQKYFRIRIPRFNDDQTFNTFTKEYVWAEIYNILSSLGGREMDIYVSDDSSEFKLFAEDLNRVFGIEKSRAERYGYGRCINVIDRMLDTLAPESKGFRFNIINSADFTGPEPKTEPECETGSMDLYRQVTENMDGKIFCGIDVGGTDIKIVLVKSGSIICYKEYDWFPAKFTTSIQLVEPICMIVRLMRAKATLDAAPSSEQKRLLDQKMNAALDISASESLMLETCEAAEQLLADRITEIDCIGMCFPDVVVRNKIVGGEVYKTRGIRNNPLISYEDDFKQLTDLNDRLLKLIKKDGKVLIINDGPMASFTAAVETAASDKPELVKNGVFAHTLGTELGTGWVTETGSIPDIPLEVYNFIIDLGSYPEREYEPDDLRSINNFNTGLPGTLQKYTSQSGVFRLAMKYFADENPRLFQELREKGYVEEREKNGSRGFYVPTEPKDMRKPFLEHMMMLPEREGDEINERIWKEVGEFLAVTWIETKKILNPLSDTRVLFGRLVKRKKCFELMQEGAERIQPGIKFDIADSSLANTRLMKQLEADPDFTLAQFAQAVGAAYFANQ